jgi:hypothetical protein
MVLGVIAKSILTVQHVPLLRPAVDYDNIKHHLSRRKSILPVESAPVDYYYGIWSVSDN